MIASEVYTDSEENILSSSNADYLLLAAFEFELKNVLQLRTDSEGHDQLQVVTDYFNTRIKQIKERKI